LFHRFGPYHHARLNAAGRWLTVWGVEACATEDIYAWSKVDGAAEFTRVTLTERDSGDRRWRRQLRRQMWRALDEIKPQVVVIPGWSFADALSALRWCAKNNTPSVVMTESTDWDEQRVPFKEWVKSRLVRLNASGLAGGTPHREYLHQLGIPRERIFLGYDVVDNDHFARRAEAARTIRLNIEPADHGPRTTDHGPNAGGSPVPTLLRDLGVSKFFLASARFVAKKNLPRLIQAYARYRAQCLAGEPKAEGGGASQVNGPAVSGPIVPWDLVLLGDGPLRSDIINLRSSLGLEECLHLPGFKQYDELPAYFGRAGAFIHASTTEQWGLVVNEAMAAGLPVLVSHRCGCAEDLVQPGVNGFQFDPHDVGEMARLLFQVSQTNFPLADFGAASRRIIAQWGPDRFATGLRDAVATALAVPRPRAGLLDRLLLRLLLER
jgi:glycosyltransferase involved in cell wall biosynthesis